jgi:polyvinyl alcohol dehydrogenase (cytochrome)
MKTSYWFLSVAGAALIVGATTAQAQAQQMPDGAALFDSHCKMCHEPAISRAPDRTTLAAMPQASIVDALTNGVMVPMAAGLTPADKTAIAAFLTQTPDAHPGPVAARGAPAGPPAPAGVDKMCATNPPIAPTATDWTSVGFDVNNRRYNPNPGLTTAEVSRLKVKWSFAMGGGSMPTVIGDYLFIANRAGKTYALDAKTGCVHWAIETASRTTPMILRSNLSPSGWLSLIGERNRRVLAFDAQTGKSIWESDALESLPAAGITGTPVISGDRVFVPLTSGEEGAANSNTYECCKFQSSLVALDLKTGKTLWQTKVVREPLHMLGKNSAGTQMWGPAGGAIWSAPTVDTKRGLVYMTTGDSYTEAPTKGADAVVAMEIATGKIRWSNQVTENDNFITNCNKGAAKPANCPGPEEGPDYDFGSSPILFNLPGGKQILLAGQKSGEAYGLNPDTGKIIWKTKVGSGGAVGGIEWGMSADDKHLYAAVSDAIRLIEDVAPGRAPARSENVPAKPGISALDPATGKIVWTTPAPVAPCHYAGDRSRDYARGACIRAQSAAPSSMPGVVFSGATDGWFRAYDTATGKIIWEDSTTSRTYSTVNGVPTQPGGSIDGMGPAIAGGMVYTMSGFNGAIGTGGNPVNVLLAYSVDGK